MGGIIPLTNTTKQQSQSSSQSSGSQLSMPIDYNPYAGSRGPFEAIIQAMMSGGMGGLSPYQFGPAPTAAMRPGETAALGDIGAMSTDPTRRGLLNQTMSGAFLPGQPGANPFLGAVIEAAQRPTMQALEQAVGRRIPGMFAAAGHNLGAGGSSPYQRELRLATEAGGRALGDIATNISGQAYDFERTQQMAAAQLGQQEVMQAIQRFGAEQLPRLIEQGGIESGISVGQQQVMQWLASMQGFQQALAPVMQALGIGTQQATSQSSSTGSAQGGIFPNVFGAMPLFR